MFLAHAFAQLEQSFDCDRVRAPTFNHNGLILVDLTSGLHILDPGVRDAVEFRAAVQIAIAQLDQFILDTDGRALNLYDGRVNFAYNSVVYLDGQSLFECGLVESE